MGKYLFTSESVSEGHPDKVCDQISDAILDAHLKKDPEARVAVETLATTQLVVLAGEVKSSPALTNDEMTAIARQVVKDIGYEQDGFHWDKMEVICRVHEQSADISKLVDDKESEEELGAGDQGIMFGFATDETDSYMPATLHYSHRILENLKAYRKANKACGLLPDAKSQVTLQYEDGVPVKADSILVSTQHVKDLDEAKRRQMVLDVIESTLPKGWLPEDEKILINPKGDFVIGGPDGDAGLTGRKIIVDTYGGAAPHGGGAFSGKDPSKVDRSAAYFARYLAKNVVAAGLGKKCSIQLSYAIGMKEPLSFYVETDGKYNESVKQALQKAVGDMTPHNIIRILNLKNPIYRQTASFGHFGRKPQGDSFSWEKLDLVSKLK